MLFDPLIRLLGIRPEETVHAERLVHKIISPPYHSSAVPSNAKLDLGGNGRTHAGDLKGVLAQCSEAKQYNHRKDISVSSDFTAVPFPH